MSDKSSLVLLLFLFLKAHAELVFKFDHNNYDFYLKNDPADPNAISIFELRDARVESRLTQRGSRKTDKLHATIVIDQTTETVTMRTSDGNSTELRGRNTIAFPVNADCNLNDKKNRPFFIMVKKNRRKVFAKVFGREEIPFDTEADVLVAPYFNQGCSSGGVQITLTLMTSLENFDFAFACVSPEIVIFETHWPKIRSGNTVEAQLVTTVVTWKEYILIRTMGTAVHSIQMETRLSARRILISIKKNRISIERKVHFGRNGPVTPECMVYPYGVVGGRTELAYLVVCKNEIDNFYFAPIYIIYRPNDGALDVAEVKPPFPENGETSVEFASVEAGKVAFKSISMRRVKAHVGCTPQRRAAHIYIQLTYRNDPQRYIPEYIRFWEAANVPLENLRQHGDNFFYYLTMAMQDGTREHPTRLTKINYTIKRTPIFVRVILPAAPPTYAEASGAQRNL